MTVASDAILAQHLSAVVQCATVSNADINTFHWAEFEKLHKLLETFYPHIYANMTLEQVGQAGLQFSYKPAQTTKAPLLLMAHQDVVEVGDRSQWNFEPFGGDIVDGIVRGRGTTDCKHILISELEAVDSLFAEGWRPDYDLYLSFGYAEEVYLANDVDAAEKLVRNLDAKGVQLGLVIDEGGNLFYEKGGLLSARIALAEKSCVNYEIYCDSPGGHSSKPGKGTALGKVAKAVVNIEEHPFPYRLTPLIEDHLKSVSSLLEEPRKSIYADPKGHWDELCKLAEDDVELDAMLHTTIAFTMASASNQHNVLPSHATVCLNTRILQGDTVASVQAYMEQYLPEGVKIRHISGKDPVPASTTDSEAYKMISSVLKGMYGDKLLVIPFLFLGASDSRYYKRIADNVLLFSGYLKDERWGEMHQVNERIPVDAIKGSVDFFRNVLTTY